MLFESFLDQHDQGAWEQVLRALRPAIHEVDRNATDIWFRFFPLRLHRALRDAADPAALARSLWLQGRYRLADQIDASHRFLYGHRWWPEVRRAVLEIAASASPPETLDLGIQIRSTAARVAGEAGTDESLLVGITAVGFMTLQQVGSDALRAAPGRVVIPDASRRRSPDDVLRARARDDWQGPLGFLKGERKRWTITFDEHAAAASYPLINSQDLATAAGDDRRDYRSADSRCSEGPIPVQCRAASCGTCWVGVLGGAEKLSEVAGHERRRIREFGYIHSDEPRPIVRLACQAQAFGAVSVVIPPWNGIAGKLLLASPEPEAGRNLSLAQS